MSLEVLRNKLCPTNGQNPQEKKYKDLFDNIPSAKRCYTCFGNLQYLFSYISTDFMKFSDDEQTEIVEGMILDFEVLSSIHQQDNILFLEKLLDALKKKKELKENHTEDDPLSKKANKQKDDGTPRNQLIIEGSNKDLGEDFGNFIMNATDNKGHLIYDGSASEVTKWFCKIFKHKDGSPFSWKTMKKHVSDGKNLGEKHKIQHTPAVGIMILGCIASDYLQILSGGLDFIGM